MLTEIKTATKRSSNKTTRAKGQVTMIVMPDGEPRTYPNVYVSCGPAVKMFIGPEADIASAKATEEAKFQAVKEAEAVIK